MKLDTTDVDRWVGVPLGGKTMKDPVQLNDIRRWVQGMQNPNPLFYDEKLAAESRSGSLLAPPSFAVATDDSHGAAPSIQGTLPGSHMLFGGDEWWFFGIPITPGDHIRRDRMLFDYRVTETKFAGPTMFSRGDTTYINQRGEVLCKQRSTSIRYLTAEAEARAGSDKKKPEPPPTWTDEELEEIQQRKFAYIATFRDLGHGKRLGVRVGDKLPTRPIGPHSVASFASEWRAFPMTVWGAFQVDPGPTSLRQAGWLPQMDKDPARIRIDPTLDDGLYHGPSRGHVDDRFARLIGMPRAYGYGASMGAWMLDTLSNWGGEWSEILHCKSSFKAPALSGDLTLIDAEVTAISACPSTAQPIAEISIRMQNQRGEVLATGRAKMRLPADG